MLLLKAVILIILSPVIVFGILLWIEWGRKFEEEQNQRFRAVLAGTEFLEAVAAEEAKEREARADEIRAEQVRALNDPTPEEIHRMHQICAGTAVALSRGIRPHALPYFFDPEAENYCIY